jgi:SAM-dependent methyltransferase
MYTIFKCCHCQGVFTDFNESEISNYYGVDYRKYNSVGDSFLNRFSYFSAKKWLKTYPDVKKVLEIGSGNGKMLLNFMKLGLDCIGTELSEEKVRELKNQYKINVTSTPLKEFDPRLKYDLVLAFHVLEHIPSPIDLLKSIKKITNSNSKIIISIPNIESLQFKLFKGLWVHLDPPRHLIHFSKFTFLNLIRECGFSTDIVSHSNFFYDVYGWVESFNNIFFKEKNILNKALRGRKIHISKLIFVTIIDLFSIPFFALVSFLTYKSKLRAIMEYHIEHTTD